MLDAWGVTAIETRVAGVTVKLVDPDTVPSVALTVTDPMLSDVASPSYPDALLTAATVGSEELHTTLVVRFCVELSENTPTAVSCVWRPFGILGLVGVTPMDTSVAAVTVSVADPETLPSVAVMVAGPWPAAVTSPLEPGALLTEPTLVAEDVQAAELVRFCVVLSVYVPVAINCCVVPLAMLGFAGVTLMETRLAAVTTKLVAPETLPSVAVTVVEPGLIAVTTPLEGLAIEATPGVNELQLTEVVRFCVELSV